MEHKIELLGLKDGIEYCPVVGCGYTSGDPDGIAKYKVWFKAGNSKTGKWYYKSYCKFHAKRYAEKYGVPMPEEKIDTL